MLYENTLAFAQSMDQADPLRHYRQKFHIPKHGIGDVIYLCGNSLGLQPKTTKETMLQELEQWKNYGVEGHFRGTFPWMYYHKFLTEQSAKVVGAHPEEVVVMNTLTTNLHLMMVSFYRPNAQRYKIIMEGGAFPSDQYAMESQVKFHGYTPEEAIVEVQPRPGETHLRDEDIIATIAEHGNETALVLFGGVNYFTGQLFDLAAITKAGHEAGTLVGFDLAHAAGNVPLQLHDWDVDFAVWCSYKYLNAGPGGPSGTFVHERHANSPELPRFAGWWGHDEDSRFLMQKGFRPMSGAAGWQLSNAQVFGFAAHKASLDIFLDVGMEALKKKSEKLTGYLAFLIKELNQQGYDFKVITPEQAKSRGCQISILTDAVEGKKLFQFLNDQGVVADWREDNLYGKKAGVIRVAPVPLYNTFEEVYRFAQLLKGKPIENTADNEYRQSNTPS